jgi:5-carboxymethyl-2-hydroxymuconate isomerase
LPHLYLEYSANIEDDLDLDGLLDKLYDTALATGIFPLGGIRVRAMKISDYRVADCDPANAFVNMFAFIGHGRPLDVRRRMGEQLFQTLTRHLDPLFASSPLAISFYIQEAHPDLSFRKNNLHDYVKQRRQ